MGKARERLGKSYHREHLEFHPEWGGSLKLWTIKFIRQNSWRYDPIVDTPDDLLQEAYCVFQRVKETYPRVIHAPHFMALYKTALFNTLCDSANRNVERKTAFSDIDADVQGMAEQITCHLGEDGAMTMLLAHAPPEVRLILRALSDDDCLLELRKPLRERRGQYRESFNSRIKRVLGLDSDADLVGSFREWLTS